MTAFFTEHDELLLGVDREQLLIQRQHQEPTESCTALVERLSRRGIESTRIVRGVSEDEITHFLDLLTAPADEVLQDDDLAEAWTDPLEHIQMNEVNVEYTTLSPEFDPENDREETFDNTSDSEQDDKASIPVNESDVRKLKQLLSCDPGPEMLHQWVKTFLRDQSSSPETYLRTVLKLLHETINTETDEDADISLDTVRRLLMHAIIHIQIDEGVSEEDIRDLMASSQHQSDVPDISRILKQKTESPFEELFSTIPRSSQGRILAHGLRGNTASSRCIFDIVQNCAPRGRELVDVISSAVDEMSEFGSLHSDGSDTSDFGRLMNGLLVNSPYQPPERTILIADDDEEYDQYLLYLSDQDGYIDHHTSGTEAWRAISSNRKQDLLILEIKLPGKTGLEMIEELASRPSPPPILVCTRYPQFQDAFEIMTYPNIEFLDKPVKKTAFRDALETFLPSHAPAEDDPDLYAPDQFERAREINERLMNRPLPDVSADIDLNRYHHTADRVGKNYIDIIPKNDQCYLLTLARVSGWGVSSTLTKLVLRNCLYFLKNQCDTVRNILIRLNRFIDSEIEPPMYANVVLGLLNTADQSIQIASAGHSSPVFWNNKKGTTSVVDLSGIPVGQVDSNRFAKYLSDHRIRLNEGDGLALSSDGLDSMSTRDGPERVRNIIEETRFKSADLVCEQYANQVETLSDENESREDMSLLAVRRSEA